MGKVVIDSKKVKEINSLGIFRCAEKDLNFEGAPYGHTIVWYDVCADNGEGDIIDSFKTLSSAEKFAREW